MLIEFHGFLPGRGQYPEIYSDWPKMLDGQMKQYVDKMVHGLLNTNEHLVLAWAVYSTWFLYGDEIGTQGPRVPFMDLELEWLHESSLPQLILGERISQALKKYAILDCKSLAGVQLQHCGFQGFHSLNLASWNKHIGSSENRVITSNAVIHHPFPHIFSLGIAVFGHFWSISRYSPSISG